MTDESNSDIDSGFDSVDAKQATKLRFTPEPVAQIVQSTGVLSSARARTGGVIANRAVEPTDIVKVRGIELSVEQALLGGFLRKDASGNFMDVDDAAFTKALDGGREADAERRRAEEEAAIQEYGVGVSAESTQALGGFVRDVERAGVNPAGALQEFIGNPNKLPQILSDVARAEGRDEGAMLQQMHKVAADLEIGVEDLLISKGGFDPAQLREFWEWARFEQQYELRSAALAAVLRSDGRGYLRLAERFQAGHGRGRGVSNHLISKARIGNELVEVIDHPQHGRIRLDVARRMGLA